MILLINNDAKIAEIPLTGDELFKLIAGIEHGLFLNCIGKFQYKIAV